MMPTNMCDQKQSRGLDVGQVTVCRWVVDVLREMASQRQCLQLLCSQNYVFV